jgi:pantetheine-phosphate adenylyltransferase
MRITKPAAFSTESRLSRPAPGYGSKIGRMHRLAIYPGSFDPPTLGHLDVIERASRLFDRIIVAVGDNSSKTPLLTVEQRTEALSASIKHLPNVEVDSFSGLLIDYAKRIGAHSIVRGLRATADFEYEFQMAMVNRRLSDDIDTVFLMTKWEYSYLSSSIVREVATLGGDYRTLVPGPVADVIAEALPGKNR